MHQFNFPKFIMNKKIFFAALLFAFAGKAIGQPSLPSTYDDYPSYNGNDLQMVYTSKATKFTFWSPAADNVYLNLYSNGADGTPYKTLNLQRSNSQEPWRITVNENLAGKFYTFQVKYNGKILTETPGAWTTAVGVNGNRSAIIDMKSTNPAGWEKDKRPVLNSPNDIILYEMHHRDMTMHASSGIKNKGKFMAWTEDGTKTPQGYSSGIDHIKELGVTHVHILPSYDYASIDETKLSQNRYNWGYDPKNYNVPEGGYSTDPYNPATRIKEFKQMVQNFHKHGIRVIMDVVYNHTFASDNSNFSLSVPGYFYRHNSDGSYSNASACGNETASEREMVRRYIVESVKYWVKEYHVDGFRFDLMGIHDIETMNEVSKALKEIDPTLFVYGEGWSAGSSPLPEAQRAVKANATKLTDVAVFSDDIRDGLKGHYSRETDKGFVTGAPGFEETIKFGIVGSTQHPQVDYSKVNYSKAPYANKPSQAIGYVSCHDDMCLVDKLKKSNPDATEAELIRFDKLAQTVVLTSQSVPFIFCGEEIFRDKKGVHNSFESPDSINAISWNNKAKYINLFKYYQGIIDLRKKHPAFKMNTAAQIQKHLKFVDGLPGNMVAYTISGNANGDSWREIMVVFNGNTKAMPIAIPKGSWTAVVKDGKVNEKGLAKINGGTIEVEASSALIVYR